MKKLVIFFLERSLLVNLFSIGLLVSGLIFITNAQREAFPNIDFDWVSVTTVFPGASAEDVEKYITIPIENQLREVEGIEEINSYSIESISAMGVKLDPDVENNDNTITDIKNAIDRVSDLPDEAEDTIVTELRTARHPVVEISIIKKNGINKDSDEFELRKQAKRLEDRLLEVKGVAKIDKKGYREREMIVEVYPDSLDTYHVAMNDIIRSLSQKNLNFPGGVVKNSSGEINIRTIGEVQSAKEIRDVLIRANDMGNWVRVGDVANVRDSFEEEKYINRTRSSKSIMLTVIKKESADIITLVDDVKAEVERYNKIIEKDFDIFLYNDFSYFVKRRLNVLINNGIVGFILVLLSLFITLGWRISLVTAFGIPLAFFGTFIWMGYVGLSINLISMFGLIMVLGMIVDDAIIVSENVYRHIEQGESVKDAVINGTSEVISPVMATILTTIAAFSPLMFMSGIMGKFIWSLPAVVTVALIASWLECMFILPSHIKDVERRVDLSSTDGQKEGRYFRFFKHHYGNILSYVIKHRYISIVIILAFFIGTIAFAKYHVKFILFPQGNIEIVVIKAEAPAGTRVVHMSKLIGKIEKAISLLPESELNIYTSIAGIIQEEPNDPFAKRGPNYGTIKVFLTPAQDRDRKAVQIIDSLREQCKPFIKEFEKVEFKMIRTGPPVGKAISIAIKGDDFETLEKIAGEFKEHLLKKKGLKDVKDDFEKGKDELRVYVNEKTAAIAGISVFDVASTIRSCYEGTVATTIRKNDEEIDIRVIFPEKKRNSLDSMKKIKVANKMGNLIPLSSIATFKRTKGISLINRKDWRRVVTVTADIDEHAKGITSIAVNQEMIEKFSTIEKRFPGYSISYEGEFKDTEESMGNLQSSFLIAILVIYIILVSIFRSLTHPIIIMSVIPFTLIGVVWTFYFHGMPLSFLAIMGVIGLAGVIVNDSIVLVDFIRKARVTGLSPFEATMQAGLTRLRPIFLTTITTFFGLIPTAYGIGGFDPFLKPMAVSLSWGLIFGTVITLLIIPVLYNIFSDIKTLFFKKNKVNQDTEIAAEVPVEP